MSLSVATSHHSLHTCIRGMVQVAQHPSSGWVFIMEHIDMGGLSRYQAALGKQLARSKEVLFCVLPHVYNIPSPSLLFLQTSPTQHILKEAAGGSRLQGGGPPPTSRGWWVCEPVWVPVPDQLWSHSHAQRLEC